MKVRYIIFGGVDSRDFGAIVDGSESYIWAERDIDSVTIPGRNGELPVDNRRFKNISVNYSMLFRSVRKMEEYRAKMLALTGYQRLEDARRPERFQMARLQGGFIPKISGVGNREGEVKLTFDCKPQRFLKSGERVIRPVSGGKLLNPGFPALPLITVWGSGAGLLRIGDGEIAFTERFTGPVILDCDTQNAYYGAENKNKEISAPAFPVLPAGESTVSWSGGVERVELIPRWWTV